MHVDLYGTRECPHCHTVADWLGENNIVYSYKLIPEDITPVELSEIVKRSVRSVPVMVVAGAEKTFEELKEDVSKMKTFDDITAGMFDLSL